MPVIATEDAIVHDEALDIDRKVIAGQPVPPDLVEAYKEEVGDGKVEEKEDPPLGIVSTAFEDPEKPDSVGSAISAQKTEPKSNTSKAGRRSSPGRSAVKDGEGNAGTVPPDPEG